MFVRNCYFSTPARRLGTGSVLRRRLEIEFLCLLSSREVRILPKLFMAFCLESAQVEQLEVKLAETGVSTRLSEFHRTPRRVFHTMSVLRRGALSLFTTSELGAPLWEGAGCEALSFR